ncbi:MAG: alanine--tRNA ligase [Alphaproteobacteria bacterium]
MKKLTYDELHNMYLDFFKNHGHKEIQNASLIPENDPTVLFTTAGMHPLVPYLLGEKHPEGTRLTDVQRCIRTGDIDEVGDTSHLTFFEMLGNWSLGDYFKQESVKMSFELLTKYLEIPVEQLAVTCFAGDKDAPRDDETASVWKECGLKDEQIFFYGKDDNWWGPAGVTGPCGPDTEIFINDLSKPECGPDCGPACHCGKYMEIWNNVFMQYNKKADGTFEPLKQKNVDTGMGLERVLRVMNGLNDVYMTELFSDVIAKLEKISGKTYQGNEKLFRKIVDHIRAATFILGDVRGVKPSNTEQGYVLRRIIRSAIRALKQLDVNDNVLAELALMFIEKHKKYYPELEQNKMVVLEALEKEETLFKRTLQSGLKEMEKVMARLGDSKQIDGQTAFHLYDTFGFPLEFTQEVASENGITVDADGFKKCFEEHQEKSRAGSEQKFKGGLADHSEKTTAYHTATHILQAVLRRDIDPNICQKGSNLTAERMRFDFSFSRKLTPEELKQVEDDVNAIISQNLPVKMQEMTLAEAQAAGAMGLFANKYDAQKVKVYTVGDNVSKEICGGPHVENTSVMGHFRILKEEASSAGVRRIKAVLE